MELDALESNFALVARTYAGTVCKMRQHGKNIKSPVVALKHIRAGGTMGGVCSAKVSEAEVMVEGGVEDILITNQIVTRDKIARACALAKQADVKVAVDDARNVVSSNGSEKNSRTTGLLILKTPPSLLR